MLFCHFHRCRLNMEGWAACHCFSPHWYLSEHAHSIFTKAKGNSTSPHLMNDCVLHFTVKLYFQFLAQEGNVCPSLRIYQAWNQLWDVMSPFGVRSGLKLQQNQHVVSFILPQSNPVFNLVYTPLSLSLPLTCSALNFIAKIQTWIFKNLVECCEHACELAEVGLRFKPNPKDSLLPSLVLWIGSVPDIIIISFLVLSINRWILISPPKYHLLNVLAQKFTPSIQIHIDSGDISGYSLGWDTTSFFPLLTGKGGVFINTRVFSFVWSVNDQTWAIHISLISDGCFVVVEKERQGPGGLQTLSI